jgi:hypothetical protein
VRSRQAYKRSGNAQRECSQQKSGTGFHRLFRKCSTQLQIVAYNLH